MFDLKKFLKEHKLTIVESANPYYLHDDPKRDQATKEITAIIKKVAPQMKSKKMPEEDGAVMVYKVCKKWKKLGAVNISSLEEITTALEKLVGRELERIDWYL